MYRVPGGYPEVTREGPRSLHFRGKRPIPRLPKLAPAAALGLSLSRSPRHVLVIALQHAGRGMRARISMPAAVLVVNPLDLGDVFEK